MECLFCGRNVNWISGTSVHGGKLCKSCSGKLPALLLKRGWDLQEYTLKNAMQKTTDNLERFSATASFGELHIDEIHGLFCIARSLTSAGKPVQGNNVFSIYDLTEVGLTCTSPRESNNMVYVDVEFKCSLADPAFSFTETIKRHCRCKSKRVDNKNVVWDAPSDLMMFQALFNQMVSGVWEKVNDILCGKAVLDFELDKARTLFMLPEGYIRDDLMLAYSRLEKVYGNLADGDGREMDIINKYYYLLQSQIEQNINANHMRGDTAL